MKQFLNVIVCIIVTLVISGCNNDVFIDRFELSTKEISVSEGESVVINVSSSRWCISGFNRTSSQSYKVTAYDSNGKETSDLSLSSPGALVYETTTTKIMVERVGSKQIIINLLRNNDTSDHVYEIVLSDYTQEQYINILTKGVKYSFENIEYSSPTLQSNEYSCISVGSVIVNNVSDKPISLNIYPYRNSLNEEVKGSVTFICNDELNSIFVDNPPVIDIPDLVNGELVRSDMTAEYNAKYPYTSNIELDFPYEKTVAVSVPAKTKIRFTTLLDVKQYNFKYRITLRNQKNKELYYINGIATVILPQANYIIASEILE